MTKSQEYLNEQAEVAQILRDGIARGLGSPGLADLILQSDWLRDRTRRAGGADVLSLAEQQARDLHGHLSGWLTARQIAKVDTYLAKLDGAPGPDRDAA